MEQIPVICSTSKETRYIVFERCIEDNMSVFLMLFSFQFGSYLPFCYIFCYMKAIPCCLRILLFCAKALTNQKNVL